MRWPDDPETRNLLKAEIVPLLRNGATLPIVAALPGMPAWGRIRYWRTRDASFDQAVNEALRRGRHRRFAAFDEVLGPAVVARYAAGETLKSIAADPEMPTRKRIDWWRITEGEFGAEINRLKAINAVVRGQVRAPPRPPRAFDQAVADAIVIGVVRGRPLRALVRSDAKFPDDATLTRWRRENPEFDADLAVAWRHGAARRHRAQRRKALSNKIVSRIVMGATLTSLGRRADMPSRRTLTRWLNEDAVFAQDVHTACRVRQERLVDEMIAKADRIGFASLTDLRRRLAPLSRQETRLRNWPAGKHRRNLNSRRDQAN